ncbi:MAG: hypothetical protein FVQ81_12540 [Candidatus Glassbacteria bacterium]|nr:hypothetical protein [Candidatus Glassbacteria bacterium]
MSASQRTFSRRPLVSSPILQAIVISVSCWLSAPRAAVLELAVLDNITGAPLACRVMIRGADSSCAVPPGAFTLEIGPDVWFASDGTEQLSLPEGRCELRVEHGKEYVRFRRWLEIPAQDTLRHTLRLERWIDMAGRGYLAAENHLHLEAPEVAAWCAAEGLDFGTSLQWWNRPRWGVPEGPGHAHSIAAAGREIPVTIYDAELEYNWGALYIVGLPNPFPFTDNPAMPNLPAALYSSGLGALNCYQGGWSPEVLLDAVVGAVDVVNVVNNNFHLHKFMPRSQYSNLLEVPGFPVYPDTPEGMMRMNLETYHRLLNCGLRLAAGAGTATGVKASPPGYNRAYIRADSSDGVQGMLDAWRAGRNFVTNGPMIFLSAGDSVRPGDEIALGKDGGTVAFSLGATSDCPLGRVWLVVNGELAGELETGERTRRAAGEIEIEFNQSGWVCAVATDSDTLLSEQELARYDGPSGPYTVRGSSHRYAHTSPIYVTVNGAPIAVERSIRQGLAMLDAFEVFCGLNCGPNYLEEMLTAIERGRQYLLSRLE